MLPVRQELHAAEYMLFIYNREVCKFKPISNLENQIISNEEYTYYNISEMYIFI
jgi:hypothetical protein